MTITMVANTPWACGQCMLAGEIVVSEGFPSTYMRPHSLGRPFGSSRFKQIVLMWPEQKDTRGK